MTPVVRLHIGAPKTGTTYVQDRLGRNAASLARHGVSYPGSAFGDPSTLHFRAALDLLGQDWGGSPGHARGAWRSMLRKVRRHDGTTVISHEILAPAPPEVVARVMRDLRGCEVHLVYSVRDLGPQLPAAWQESIKQGRKWSFRRFLDVTEQGDAWFARAFDVPRVLENWGRDLPSERIHLVTVPQRGAAPSDLLWRRVCQALDVDPAWAPEDSPRVNRSLGVAETQVIRRLNRRLRRRTRRDRRYDDLVLLTLTRNRTSVPRSPRVTLAPDRYGWAEQEAERWRAWIADSGVDVIGDLDDLVPTRPARNGAFPDPDQVPRSQLLRATLDALEAMTVEAAGRRQPVVRRVQRRLGRAPGD